MNKLICKECKRQLPNKDFKLKKGCIWCSVEHYLKNLKRDLKFRPITLRLDNEEILEWQPLAIKRIEIYDDYIRINDEVVEKSDCYYPHWEQFCIKLSNLFEIERY